MHDRFPQEAFLRDGSRLLVRPFTAADTGALWAFFHGLPEDVRRFAWDRIDNRALIEQWGLELDYDRVLPLIATDGHRIVADATLHRRKGSPLRLVGRIKWLMEPKYRGQGIAHAGLAAVCALVFKDVPRCSLYVNQYNVIAQRVYARLGFKPADTFATVMY